MGRHDTYLSAAGTRPPTGRGRRGQRDGFRSLGSVPPNRRPLPIRTENDPFEAYLAHRPPVDDWADDVESEEGEIPFQPVVARREPLPERPARAAPLPPARVEARGTFTLHGSSLSTEIIYRREPFALPPHLSITGVYSATAAEHDYSLLFLDYTEAGVATTLDKLNDLRAQFYADVCNTFNVDPTVFDPADSIQICTRQSTTEGTTIWVTTGHVVVKFPTKDAAIQAYRQQQDPATVHIKTFSNVPCMVHIAGKPAIDPGAKFLHQAWLQGSEFAGLTEDEVYHGIISALHHTWRSCLTAITPTSAEEAEAALLVACAEADDATVITLEPVDALYALEFYRLHKPSKSSTAVRLEWPSAAIPSILRDSLADKSARLSIPFFLPGGTRLNVPLRALPGPPGSKRLDETLQTNAEAAEFSRHSVTLQFFYPKEKFMGFLLPPLADFAAVLTQIFNYHLDRGALSALRLFEQHLPGVPWAIPNQASIHRGVAIDLALNSRLGEAGFLTSGSYYEELSDTNRIIMSVGTYASQIFAVLLDTVTVYLAPAYPGDRQLHVLPHLCKGGKDRPAAASLAGLRVLNIRTASSSSSLLGWLAPRTPKSERAQWAIRKLRSLRPYILQQLALNPTPFDSDTDSDRDKRLRQVAQVKLVIEEALAEASSAEAAAAAAEQAAEPSGPAAGGSRRPRPRENISDHRPPLDPWTEDYQPPPQPTTRAESLAVARRDKRPMLPQEGAASSLDLQAAFQEVGLQSTSTSAAHGTSPLPRPDDPASAAVAAADHAIGQALAGLNPAAREDAVRQLLTGLSPQPDAKRRAASHPSEPTSPMLD